MFDPFYVGQREVVRPYRPIEPRPDTGKPTPQRPGDRAAFAGPGNQRSFVPEVLILLLVLGVNPPITAQVPVPASERVDEDRSVEKQWDAARAARSRIRQGVDPLAEVLELLEDRSGTVRDEVFEEIVEKWSAEQRRKLRNGFSTKSTAGSGFIDEILAEIFFRCPDPTMAPELISVALGSDVAEAREMALGALGQLAPEVLEEKALIAIEKMAKRERNWWIRGEALRCLAHHDAERATPLLKLAMREKKLPALRIAALQGYALVDPELGCEIAFEAICKPWKDRQGIWGERIVRAALAILADHLAVFPRLKQAQFISALIEASESLEGATRERMWSTLAIITGETGVAPRFDAWDSWWQSRRESWLDKKPLDEGAGSSGDPSSGDDSQSKGKTRVVQYHGVPLDSKRLVFLADVSGGMSRTVDGQFDGEGARRIDVSRAELLRVLGELPPDALVQVVHFGSRSHPALPRVQPLARSLRGLTEKIRQQKVPSGRGAARGNLYGPLRRAVLEPGTDTVMLLTEGAPTEGKVQNGDRLRWHIRRWNRWGQARIHVLSVGRIRGDNRAFLEGLAADGGGLFHDVDGTFGK
ncbi:MAG: hypothetical protein AAEJ04_02530 [Planctomycetota bacterium]